MKSSMTPCALGLTRTHACTHTHSQPGTTTYHKGTHTPWWAQVIPWQLSCCAMSLRLWATTVNTTFPWSFNIQILLKLPRPFPLMRLPLPPPLALMNYFNNKKQQTLDKICLRAFPTISGSPWSRWSLQAFRQYTSIQKVINKCSWITLPFINRSLWIVLG